MSLAQTGSIRRGRRIRRCASRRLDEQFGETVPLALIDRGDWWHIIGMDCGVPEREHLGRELATVVWVP